MANAHRHAIEQLIFSYAERIDCGDFDGVADLMAHARVSGPNGLMIDRQRAGVLRLYEMTTRRYDDGTPRTKHVTTNLTIKVDEAGARATARSYFTVLQALEDFPLQVIIAGRYHDDFQCVEGHWRFYAREIIPDLYGDLSRHLLVDPQTA